MEELVSGRMRVPNFQRGFVWDPERVSCLMDSIYKGYPFGSVLLWRARESLSSERKLGPFELPSNDPSYPTDYILDGHLASKTRIIATLKVLGATSGTIAAIFLAQLGMVAAAGIGGGLLVGAAVPWLVTAFAGASLPVPPRLTLYPVPLAIAALLALLVALLFALPALARAREIPAATLLRDALGTRHRPSAIVLGLITLLLAALVALAVLTASDKQLAVGFVGAVAALIALLWFFAWSSGSPLRNFRGRARH